VIWTPTNRWRRRDSNKSYGANAARSSLIDGSKVGGPTRKRNGSSGARLIRSIMGTGAGRGAGRSLDPLQRTGIAHDNK
jgi:hypothetical protein